jgi:hypothetical protein
MAGGYISCGSFMGGDKSGSAFQGLLEAIECFRPVVEAEQFRAAVIGPVLEQGYSEDQTLSVPADVVPHSADPLRRYYDHQGRQMGHPLPHDAPDLDKVARLDPVAAKWGEGPGWQYYCAHDLLKAWR